MMKKKKKLFSLKHQLAKCLGIALSVSLTAGSVLATSSVPPNEENSATVSVSDEYVDTEEKFTGTDADLMTDTAEKITIESLADLDMFTAGAVTEQRESPFADIADEGRSWKVDLSYVKGDNSGENTGFVLKYQLQFRTNEDIQKNNAEIHVPLALLHYADGTAFAPSVVGTPELENRDLTVESDSTPFNCFVDGEDLVFFNYKDIPAFTEAVWQIVYSGLDFSRVPEDAWWYIQANTNVSFPQTEETGAGNPAVEENISNMLTGHPDALETFGWAESLPDYSTEDLFEFSDDNAGAGGDIMEEQPADGNTATDILPPDDLTVDEKQNDIPSDSGDLSVNDTADLTIESGNSSTGEIIDSADETEGGSTNSFPIEDNAGETSQPDDVHITTDSQESEPGQESLETEDPGIENVPLQDNPPEEIIPDTAEAVPDPENTDLETGIGQPEPAPDTETTTDPNAGSEEIVPEADPGLQEDLSIETADPDYSTIASFPEMSLIAVRFADPNDSYPSVGYALFVEKYDGSQWQPASGINYVLGHGPLYDRVYESYSVQSTGTNGRIYIESESNNMPWVQFTEDKVFAEDVVNPSAGDLRITARHDNSMDEWGYFIGVGTPSNDGSYTVDLSEMDRASAPIREAIVNQQETETVKVGKSVVGTLPGPFEFSLQQIIDVDGTGFTNDNGITVSNYNTVIEKKAPAIGIRYNTFETSGGAHGSYIRDSDNGFFELNPGEYTDLTLPVGTLWTISENGTELGTFMLDSMEEYKDKAKSSNDSPKLLKLEDNLMLIGDDVTAYKKDRTYTIIMDPNGGYISPEAGWTTDGLNIKKTGIAENSFVTLPYTEPTGNGNFDGWILVNENNPTNVRSSGAGITVSQDLSKGSETLYFKARWKKIEYTVELDTVPAEGGDDFYPASWSGSSTKTGVEEGDTIILPTEEPTNSYTYKEFLGWQLNGTTYSPGQSVVINSSMAAGGTLTITFTAVWGNLYTVNAYKDPGFTYSGSLNGWYDDGMQFTISGLHEGDMVTFPNVTFQPYTSASTGQLIQFSHWYHSSDPHGPRFYPGDTYVVDSSDASFDNSILFGEKVFVY